MAKNLETGRLGETLARHYLEQHGYEILEVNWRWQHLEVDIIARRGDTIAFVEVKTRSGGSYLRARDSVAVAKEQHLIRAASHYVAQISEDYSIRYDIIAIDLLPERRYRIEHIQEAFYPSLRHHKPKGRRKKPLPQG